MSENDMLNSAESYSYFAKFYDRLTENVDHKAIAQRYCELITEYSQYDGDCKGVAVDLGCGTGSLAVELARCGFCVIGVDISEDMLSVAYNKLSPLPDDVRKNIQLVRQDISRLELGGTDIADVVVSSLDCLNHLPCADDVKATMKCVSQALKAGGLFVFDVNTIHKHRDILADNAFVFEQDGFMCTWQNFFNSEDNSVDILLDFFEEQKNGSYKRFSEEFSEQAYPIADVKAWLCSCGLETVCAFDSLTSRDADENCERVLICARKANK